MLAGTKVTGRKLLWIRHFAKILCLWITIFSVIFSAEYLMEIIPVASFRPIEIGKYEHLLNFPTATRTATVGVAPSAQVICSADWRRNATRQDAGKTMPGVATPKDFIHSVVILDIRHDARTDAERLRRRDADFKYLIERRRARRRHAT